MLSLCVDPNPNELRGLDLFGNHYYIDGKERSTSHVVGEYKIKSGSSIILSALVAGNAQGFVLPPIIFSLTEYGDNTILTHQSTPCNGRNMCIIIDLDK